MPFELHDQGINLNPDDFGPRKTGRLIPTIKGMAFVPDPLPPHPLEMDLLARPLARAERALGELNGVGRTLQNPYLLLRPFMRREAVASSRIEGTVTTLPQLLLFELDEETTRAPSDAREVLNYVRALERAIARLDTLPISSRLIKEMHEVLLTDVASHRGAGIVPDEYRREQNWIGARSIESARYVPPPPQEVDRAMSDLESYINSESDELPLLIRLALIHYQFEAIHPFPDGNGRVGRLLLPLILCARKETLQPLLYLSTYFERHYDAYIDHMLAVSQSGLWTPWIEFFLIGVEEACKDAVQKAQLLLDLHASYRARVQRARSSALLGQLVDLLFERPAITVPLAAERLGISYNAAKNNIRRLMDYKILRASAAEVRPKYFVAEDIMNVLM
jgi:Fic family protein